MKFGIFSGKLADQLQELENSQTWLENAHFFHKHENPETITAVFKVLDAESIDEALIKTKESGDILSKFNDLDIFPIWQPIDRSTVNISDYMSGVIVGWSNFAKNNPMLAEIARRISETTKNTKKDISSTLE
jgi:hypothetical protein